MFPKEIPAGFGVLVLVGLTLILYWQFYLLGKIPMPADTIIGAYFPWLDYKWGFSVGVPVKNALISDVFSQFFVWKYLAMDIYKTGNIPFWNTTSLSGTPLMATYHSSVFNPFNIFLLLPKYYGWGFYISLQTFFALLGMYLLLGNYSKNIMTRVFGSVVFSLSGLMTTWVEFGTGVWAASMLPWIFFFLEKYLNLKKIRYLFFMAVSFMILYLSGHAQLTMYSSALVFIYLFVKYLKRKILKEVLFAGIFVLLAAGVCAFQFLPTFEFTKNSIRANENYSSSFNYGLNPPYEFAKFVAADIFGNPTTGNYWDSQSYHEQSIFLGVIPVILILSLLIFNLRKKQFDFWIGTFLVSIFLGFENPLTKLLYSLPLPFITYSSAARIFFLTSFSGGILAAMALDKLSDKNFLRLSKTVNFYTTGALVGLLIGFTILIYLTKNLSGSLDLSIYISNYSVTIKNLLMPVIMSLISLVMLTLLGFKPKIASLILIILVVFSFSDLARYFYKYNPFIAQNLVFPDTPSTQFLKSQNSIFRIARLDSDIMPPNTWTHYNMESVEGYDPLLSENYGRLFNLVNKTSYNSTLSRYRELDNFNPLFLDALNVKYFLSIKRDEKGSAKGEVPDPKISTLGYQAAFEDKNTLISKNPNALERAYFVSKLQSLPNKESLISIISSKDFNPKNEALIQNTSTFPEITGKGTVEIATYSPNKIQLKTLTEGNEFLVLADTFNNGWKLKRNGIEEKIYETNLALRGILVPPGENTFIMEYWPDSFKYGLWLTSLSCLTLLCILIYSIKRKTI